MADEKPELKILENGCVTVENTEANISKLLSQIRKYQEGVKKHIDSNYVEFLPSHTSADLYLEEGEALLREAEHLLHNTEKDADVALREASTEIAACTEQLQEASLGLKVVNRVLKVDDLFQCVEEANARKDYLIVLDLLSQLKSLISCEKADSVDRVFQRCDCYDTIKVKYHVQANVLRQNLQQRFERLVQFTEKLFPQTKCVTLQISKDVTQLQDTVLALFQARFNPSKLCMFLLENCIEPLIIKPVAVEYSEDNDEFNQLVLSYSIKDLGNSLRPSYKQVFENILQLLNFLSDINVSISAEQQVFSIIGDHVKERFLKYLIDECLKNAIPETIDEMEESTLVADVINFEQALADTDLINIEKDRALFEFTEKFEILFRNHFFKKVLDNAQDIMQKDLQDMMVINEKNTNEDVTKNPFSFPHCTVSKSTLELIKLLERLLRQPHNENDEDDETSYLNIVPVILNAYINTVPKIHEKLLDSIPQQSALFYNNCMLLAHWLTKNLGKSIPTNPALQKCLQTIGTKYLNVQITHQQNIIKGILKDFDISNVHSLGQGQVKLIRQCLRQMELLKNVWQSVLPETVYNKTFCDILNDFCSDIIKRTLAMEDMSATVASELSDLIGIILEKAPALFKNKHDVLQVKTWMKLEQLKMILNASLLDITEQWCEGAGILTANYKAEEIRHLIKALFQNTDRRALALAKIV